MAGSRRIINFSAPFVDQKEADAVVKVLRSGWWTTGREAERFERDFCDYVGCAHAVAVSSATAALHLALKCARIERGDEVLVPTMTFAATAEAVIYCGAKPVLCDCEKGSSNIDIEDIKRNITKRTKAIIPVHMGGLPCRMEEIGRIAGKYGIHVIEDAAHALGAKYKGRMVGLLGDYAAFSFYATKPISTGEGGMLITSDKRSADMARCLSLHGLSRNTWKRHRVSGYPQYDIKYAGFKYNMPDILAALGVYQLRKAEEFLRMRTKYAKTYTRAFERIDAIELPASLPEARHAWHLYSIKLIPGKLKIGRDEFMNSLRREGISTGIHFKPLHLHSFYRKTFRHAEKDFPAATQIFKNIVSLPLYSSMKTSEVEYVISRVKKILMENKK